MVMGVATGFAFRGARAGFAATYVYHIKEEAQIECAADAAHHMRRYVAPGKRSLRLLYPILGVYRLKTARIYPSPLSPAGATARPGRRRYRGRWVFRAAWGRGRPE